jgi:MFS transporter, DHA2 family, multidrug resistance protein
VAQTEKEEATKRGVPPNSSQLPTQALQPGFMAHVTSDLSHACTVVFVVAAGFVLTTLIPAAFLPKKAAADLPA